MSPATPIDRPVFIVGSGRSGTTLVRSVLSAHSRIAIAPETHFLKRVDGPGPGGPPPFERLISEYVDTIRFSDIGTTKQRWLELIDEQGERSARTAFTALLLAYQERTGKPRIGEKTPGHVHHLHRLLSWFPDASVVVLRRDPRAVLASKAEAPWVLDRLAAPSLRAGVVTGTRLEYFASHARLWRRTYGSVVPSWEHDDRILVIDYEDLVTKPELAVRRLCSFLGERFEPRMLTDRSALDDDPGDGSTTNRHTDMRRVRQGHLERSRRPVSPTSLERWRERLTPFELALVDGVCGDVAATVGHEITTRRLVRLAAASVAPVVLGAGKVERAVRRAVVGRGSAASRLGA